jgi:hypothetical protein
MFQLLIMQVIRISYGKIHGINRQHFKKSLPCATLSITNAAQTTLQLNLSLQITASN